MEERYPGLTGAGLASLLAALPRLRLLIADPHLLKDAILFLHNVNVTSRTFPLQHLYLRLTTKDLSCQRNFAIFGELLISYLKCLPVLLHLTS